MIDTLHHTKEISENQIIEKSNLSQQHRLSLLLHNKNRGLSISPSKNNISMSYDDIESNLNH